MLKRFLTLGVIQALPTGMVADKSANFGLLALMSNINAYAEKAPVTIAGTTTTNLAVTISALMAKNILMTVGNITGAFTITLPTTAAILSALGPTIPTDGTFSFPVWFVNVGIGQTGTVTAGDASTTITGTATIATTVASKYMFNVTSATTITATYTMSASN